MACLDADVLTQVFLNLSFTERVKLESVCQLWYFVLKTPACFYMRELNIADFLSYSTSDYYQQDSISFTPIVLGVVRRCGRSVRALSFGARWLKISQPIIDCVAMNCTQLRELDLGAVILAADVSELLQRVAPRLERLSLEETSWISDEHGEKYSNGMILQVAAIFHLFRRLHTLNVRSAMFPIANIVSLPRCLRRIEISHAHRFPAEAMVAFLRTHPALEHVTACPAPVFDQNIMNALAGLPSLSFLELGYMDDASIDATPLAAARELRTLRLKNVACLNERSLTTILASLPFLSELSLIKCDAVHDYAALGLCAALTTLIIENTMQLSDDDLIVLASHSALRTLHLTNCLNVSADGVAFALEHCQLRKLLLSSCSGVTDEALFVAADTQDAIEEITVSNCAAITSKGVASLAFLPNLLSLRLLDVSRSRKVDDVAVLAIHNALMLKRERHGRRAAPCLSASDTDCFGARSQRRRLSSQMRRAHYKTLEGEQTLKLCVGQTSISSRIEEQVHDLIQVAY